MFTIRQFCEATQVSERTARRMVSDGRLRVVRLPGVKGGTAIRVPADEMQRFQA